MRFQLKAGFIEQDPVQRKGKFPTEKGKKFELNEWRHDNSQFIPIL